MNFTSTEIELLPKMAREFYGYGAYERPYWFVGTEPGGGNIEHLRRKLQSWKALGCEELVCNKKHHLGADIFDHHRDGAGLQSTWRPLMLGFMSYKSLYRNDETTTRWLKDEQIQRFGCEGGDSAVIELGGLPAADRNHWPYAAFNVPTLMSRERYVDEYFGQRALHLHAMAARTNPKFVWMYGARKAYKKYWKAIAGGDFEVCDAFDFRQVGGTTFFVTDHTTSRGKSNAYWVALGNEIRELATQGG